MADMESRPVWGAWIEIKGGAGMTLNMTSRAPYGARGLKYVYSSVQIVQPPSRPVWGAWIEISANHRPAWAVSRRAPYGARGLKSEHNSVGKGRGRVAPRMGRVD